MHERAKYTNLEKTYYKHDSEGDWHSSTWRVIFYEDGTMKIYECHVSDRDTYTVLV